MAPFCKLIYRTTLVIQFICIVHFCTCSWTGILIQFISVHLCHLVHVYRVGLEKRATLLLSISSPVIDNFQNSFTGTLCRQFEMTWLLHIPPHHKCVSTLPCEISMKYAYITIITNKHFGKIEKKHFRPTLQWMVLWC